MNQTESILKLFKYSLAKQVFFGMYETNNRIILFSQGIRIEYI